MLSTVCNINIYNSTLVTEHQQDQKNFTLNWQVPSQQCVAIAGVKDGSQTNVISKSLVCNIFSSHWQG